MKNKIAMKAALGVALTMLSLIGVVNDAFAVLIIDKNVKRIQENACIDIDFLEKYEPTFSPRWEAKVFTVSYATAEELAEVHTVLYGCDLLSEESKINPDNAYQDGTVFLIWANMGRNREGRLSSIFDSLNSDKAMILRPSYDERVYSTFEDAVGSPEMERIVQKFGVEKVYVQGFSLSGEDKGLFALDQTIVQEVPQ